MADFISEDDDGQCFICLGKIAPTQTHSIKQETDFTDVSPSSIKYLQYFFHYLKMNSLNGDEAGDPIDNNVKVELCEECIPLNEKFSKLYNQLETIEMEVMECLQLIHRRLAGTEEDFRQNDNIIHDLRKSAIQKCSNKLSKAVPRVITNRLNWVHFKDDSCKAVKEERTTHEPGSQEATEDENDFLNKFDLHDQPDLGTSNLDMEHVPTSFGKIKICPIQVQDLSTNLHTAQFEGGPMEDSCEVAPGAVEDSSPDVNPEGIFGLPEDDDSDKDMDMTGDGGTGQSIPPPIEVSGSAVQPQCTVDRETGTRKCNLCSKNCGTYRGFIAHHRTVHRKIRYKCTSCPATFTMSSHYRAHYSNKHRGERVSCEICTISFATKKGLLRHNASVHLRKRYSCQFCSSTFTQSSSRNTHMRLYCPSKPK